ncbi:MAG: hypothetical protein RL417_888 [Pseudomonadota bacterium]|jgi:hypothetical protein
MRGFFKVFFGLVVVLGVAGVAEAQLSQVCPTVKSINDRKSLGVLVQYKNNQVQRTGGVGTPITFFKRNPTIIETQGKRAFKNSRAKIYDKNGKAICTSAPRLGCSVTRGECLSRYKFNCSTSKIRRATSNGGAFVKVSSNLCVNVPNAGKCYNVKVRDLCDGRVL